ncbi:hypothetical protein AB6A40_009769 [Gnathostoma spinigerum]|uniref:Uncharacterized protein n=1 Tax=Gnathostoma spinigerum TaxID=75299 RepID=A0ABD6ESW7_9BILA
MRSKSECPTVRLDSVISEENDVSQHSELNEKLRTNQTNTLRAENLRAAVETPDSCALRPDKNEILLGIDKLLHAEGSSC